MNGKFRKFLKKYKAMEKFKEELEYYSATDIENFVISNNPEDFIVRAFAWDRTPQGHNYWNKLEELWLRELEDNKEVI